MQNHSSEIPRTREAGKGSTKVPKKKGAVQPKGGQLRTVANQLMGINLLDRVTEYSAQGQLRSGGAVQSFGTQGRRDISMTDDPSSILDTSDLKPTDGIKDQVIQALEDQEPDETPVPE